MLKERCQAKFLEGHLNELGLLILIGPNKSGSFVDEAKQLIPSPQPHITLYLVQS